MCLKKNPGASAAANRSQSTEPGQIPTSTQGGLSRATGSVGAGATGGGGAGGGNLNWKAPTETQRPKALVCYICGREFGTKSLDIHLKTCKKKWEAQEAQKPAKQRRPLP